MNATGAHSVDLIRYLDGELPEADRAVVEQHVGSCAACRAKLSFIRTFHHSLSELSQDELTTREPCPDSWTLVSYEAGDVDEKTARHLRVHLLLCDACAEEFYALRQVSGSEATASAWHKRVEKLKKFVIDLAKTYGSGAILGSIRIVAEGPAFAERSAGVFELVSKILEMSVGENIYRIEISVRSNRSLSCDIQGYKIRHETPATIAVRSNTGDEIAAAETDQHGNSYFVLTADQVPPDVYVFALSLDDSEGEFLFQVP